MATKFMVVLLEHGYMTSRRSTPNHMIMRPSRQANGLVTSFSRTFWRGIKKRKALFPDPNGFMSSPTRAVLVADCCSSR